MGRTTRCEYAEIVGLTKPYPRSGKRLSGSGERKGPGPVNRMQRRKDWWQHEQGQDDGHVPLGSFVRALLRLDPAIYHHVLRHVSQLE